MTATLNAQPAAEPARKKPRLALAVATALGVGYIPKAPGTFGSLAGVAVAIFTHPISLFVIVSFLVSRSRYVGIGLDVPMISGRPVPILLLLPSVLAILVITLIGVWSSSRTAAYAGVADPQYVVIDEVVGMHLTLVLGIMPLALPTRLVTGNEASAFALYSALSLLNWKYLLTGLILFRVFDIWKPWPIHRLEKLPGGWGIMADDWMASVYAAILLRVALHFNLV